MKRVLLLWCLAASLASADELVRVSAKVFWTNRGEDAGLIAAPSLVVPLGEWAEFGSITEIPVPENYDPPRVPENLAASVRGGGTTGGITDPKLPTHPVDNLVIPAFPRDFGQRETGLTLKFKPSLGPDGKLGVECHFEQVALRGFVDRGVPVTVERKAGSDGKKARTQLLGESPRREPDFFRRSRVMTFGESDFSTPVEFPGQLSPPGAEATDPNFAAALTEDRFPPLSIRVKAEKIAPAKSEVPENVDSKRVRLEVKAVEIRWEDGSEKPVLLDEGLLDEPGFHAVIRRVSGTPGMDLSSSPTVTGEQNRPARIEVIREFIFPVDWDPPAVPENPEEGAFPAAPTSPKVFETRNLGLVFDLKPRVLENGWIEVEFSPERSDFLEFLNFGSPIDLMEPGSFGNRKRIRISENRMEMPAFRRFSARTRILVPNRGAAMIGGWVHRTTQVVEDKIPVLGDLPLIGGVGRRQFELKIAGATYFFLTAELVDSGE